MLTDIFANRYSGMVLWETFEEKDGRFLVQAFRIISEQFYPYYRNGNEDSSSKSKWKILNQKLSLELGLENLSNLGFSYNTTWQGKVTTSTSIYPLIDVCKNFVFTKYDGSISADRFMKERISFIELAFREKENEIQSLIEGFNRGFVSRNFEHNIRAIVENPSAKQLEGKDAFATRMKEPFLDAVTELNTRFRQTNYNLHYHNGFIQRSTDQLTEEQIEAPFWSLVAEPKWVNVDHDIKEAIDLRDNGGRDPALYAAKALESTIKIISDDKGWTHGGEKGAINYIENLRSKKNGEFINAWEQESLAKFFSTVRNPLGHGAGSNKMPELSAHQTDWAIEFCMIWIKHLIRKL